MTKCDTALDFSKVLYDIDDELNLTIGFPNGSVKVGKLSPTTINEAVQMISGLYIEKLSGKNIKQVYSAKCGDVTYMFVVCEENDIVFLSR